MKVLFLAPRFPLPADTGGKIRTSNILKQVSTFASVRLVCFSFEKEDGAFVPELEKFGIKVTLVPGPRPNFFKKVIAVLTDKRAYSIAKYDTQEMQRTIAGLLSQEQFDLVHVDHLHMASYCEFFGISRNSQSKSHNVTMSKGVGTCDVVTLLDEHNIEFKILERCALAESRRQISRLYKRQAKKTKKFETAMVPQFDAVTVVSEDDKMVLQELAGEAAHIEVLPNGVDTEYFDRSKGQEVKMSSEGEHLTSGSFDLLARSQEEAIVFTGSMDWLPNDDAMQYFIKEVLPLLWYENRDIVLFVVGKSPSKELQKLAAGDERIVLTGRVDDVRPYLARAKIFIVPLRIGGGTRLKILEAMSFGIPVVSTTLGAEGIQYENGTNIMLADEPKDLVNSILYLFQEKLVRKRLAQAGRKLVEEKYEWRIIGEKLKKIYEEILKRD